MSWRLARSLTALRSETDRRWPGRDTTSDGTIGDRAHSSRTSDHNPDDQGRVCAIDITRWNDCDRAIAEHLRATRDPRVKYVISRGQMFSSYQSGSRNPWEWGTYSGSNQHNQHVHISVTQAGADDPSPWGLEGNWMDAVKAVLFAANDTDRSVAEAGATAAYGTGLLVTTDTQVAQAALDGGVTVWCIGGPAVRALPGGRPVKGETRTDTLTAVAAQAAEGW